MKKFCALVFALAAPGLSAAQDLFDGKTLTHWSGNPEHWRIEDGAITGEIPEGQSLKRNEWIFWGGEVHDFDLQLEFRITGGPSANSGIQYRCQQGPNGSASGYQADLDDGKVWLGRIYDEHGRGLLVERGARISVAPDGRRWADVFAEPKAFANLLKKGEWNRYRITATASHVEVRVNDVLCSVLDDHEARAAEFSGKIAFQLHGGPGPAKVQFRNIRLTHLGKTEMPERPIAPKPEEMTGIKPTGEDGKTLNLDFETGTLAGWKVEGSAWDKQPIEGDSVAIRKRGNSQHSGRFWLGGYERMGDKGTGVLTSSPFKVTHPWASFLIGAGDDPKQTRVELVEANSGRVIYTATGKKLENMERELVKVDSLLGQNVFIRIVDASTGGWGHINFDDFIFHDQPPSPQQPTPRKSGERATRAQESPVLWHLTPNPAKPQTAANPKAQKLVADMKLAPGFQAELIAAEPDVRQPIAFCIDERGRLWVAEAFSYPNKQPEGQGKDRISIFEDKDGDGAFESNKVFVEGLNLVSGLEIGFGGVWIGAAPELLFIPRDAEDQPGKPQVLLDGWGYQDTHETLNSFTWGPDGWLYGNQGVFTKSLIGKPGTADEKRIALNSGVWRYHPVRHEFEIFASGGSNQWGLDYNSNGHLFMTHCRSFWGKGGTTHVIRNGHFWNQSNSKYAPFISATAPSFAPQLQNYLPAAARYDSGEGGAGKPGTTAVYGGHSHVGTMIYQGDNWPEIYRDHLFTHNLHGHQINHQHNVRTGSGYETLHAGYDLLFSDHEEYIPVDLQTGPDGAVYVIDWCDTQHCHNPTDEKWDRSNGRIYRLSWAQTYKPRRADLGGLTDVELAQMQTHRNDWHVRTARRLLQERAASRKIDAPAVALLKQQMPDLRSLWALHVIGEVDSVLAKAAQDDNDITRAWAIQLATEQHSAPRLSSEVLLQLARNDPSPTVRLTLASALPNLKTESAWDIASALAMHGEDSADRFLPKMIWFGLAGVIHSNWPRALKLAEETKLPELADSIHWYAALSPQSRDLLVPQMLMASEEQRTRQIQLLAFGLKDEAKAPMPKDWPALQARHARNDPAIDQLAVQFGDQSVVARMREVLADEQRPLSERQRAFNLLKRSGDAEATPIFTRLIDHESFRSAVIPLLSRSSDSATAEILMSRFDQFSAADRSAALATLTSRGQLALPLLEAVRSGRFDKKHLSALQVRQMRNLQDGRVNEQLDQMWGKANESSETVKATIAQTKQAYQTAPLWAFDGRAGQETFTQLCAACHTLNGAGGKLGPDLTGSWRNGLDYFLENIIDPNAVVGDNFQLNILTRRDGTVQSGVIEKETDTAITLRTVAEAVTIPKAELKDRQKLAQSIMPPGLLEALPERKRLELLKFLLSKQE